MHDENKTINDVGNAHIGISGLGHSSTFDSRIKGGVAN